MDEFMAVYQVAAVDFNGANSRNMLSLTSDEVVELEHELYVSPYQPIGDEVLNKPNIVKESLDVIYVLAQRLRRMGVDVDASLDEVHRSNMSKTVAPEDVDAEIELALPRYPGVRAELLSEGVYAGRYVLRCCYSGKVIKPSTYSPAVIVEGVHYDI